MNLDKLRNIVQKFGSRPFTTEQVAMDYHHQEQPATPEQVEAFRDMLERHAAVLGIQHRPDATQEWQAV